MYVRAYCMYVCVLAGGSYIGFGSVSVYVPPTQCGSAWTKVRKKGKELEESKRVSFFYTVKNICWKYEKWEERKMSGEKIRLRKAKTKELNQSWIKEGQ